jgi:hypothetical protein
MLVDVDEVDEIQFERILEQLYTFSNLHSGFELSTVHGCTVESVLYGMRHSASSVLWC